MIVLVTQSFPTLCDPMDHSLPGSSVHGILQAWILDWVAIFFSKVSSWPRNQTSISFISCISRRVLYHYCHLGSLNGVLQFCEVLFISLHSFLFLFFRLYNLDWSTDSLILLPTQVYCWTPLVNFSFWLLYFSNL